MANPLALAAVTAVLRSRLRQAVGGDWTPELPRTTVVTLQPDHVAVTDETGPMVNVLLWDVRVASEMRTGLPAARISPSAATPKPVVLSYLVCAYGVRPLESDILLGQVLSAVLDEPVITAAAIRSALDPATDDESGLVPARFRREAVRLADTVDHLTLTCRSMTLDEWAGVWQSARVPSRPGVMLDVTGATL